jgi:hypothetical protein
MLGVRRASVTVVASMLQQARVIAYSRGRIRIVDRVGLERISCGCYRAIKENYEKLVVAGPIAPKRRARGARR